MNMCAYIYICMKMCIYKYIYSIFIYAYLNIYICNIFLGCVFFGDILDLQDLQDSGHFHEAEENIRKMLAESSSTPSIDAVGKLAVS